MRICKRKEQWWQWAVGSYGRMYVYYVLAAAAAADTEVQDFLLLLFDCVKQRITFFSPETLKRPWDRDPAKVMCHWAVPVCLCTACKHCDKFPRFFNTW